MYLQYYIMGIIILPGILLAIYAEIKVHSAFNAYNRVYTNANITAEELIKRLLTATNMENIAVKQIGGELTDYYDSSKQEICLSQSVYSSTSVAALGIACHEYGHALQKKERYAPYQIRRIVIPVSNFASKLLWPLVIIGILLNFVIFEGSIIGDIFLWSGIAFFGLSVLVNLVTLPVEFDASRRAIKILKTTGLLSEEELEGTRKVLSAAALTYVAALVVSILQLLRFLLFIFANRSRN